MTSMIRICFSLGARVGLLNDAVKGKRAVSWPNWERGKGEAAILASEEPAVVGDDDIAAEELMNRRKRYATMQT